LTKTVHAPVGLIPALDLASLDSSLAVAHQIVRRSQWYYCFRQSFCFRHRYRTLHTTNYAEGVLWLESWALRTGWTLSETVTWSLFWKQLKGSMERDAWESES